MGGPLRFILTGGQESDIGQAEHLLAGIQAGALLADKAYDADALLNTLRENQMDAVIPPKANRTVQRPYDEDLYKERHLIECFFGKIKHYRRVFSRYEKLAINYLSMLSFVGALIWLR